MFASLKNRRIYDSIVINYAERVNSMFDYHWIDGMDINGEAPVEEPARQYYFMKKCKQWAAGEERRLGRKLTLSMQTMGCPVR